MLKLCYFVMAVLTWMIPVNFPIPNSGEYTHFMFFGWGKSRLWANHLSLFPQLSYNCQWQLLLEEGRRGAGTETQRWEDWDRKTIKQTLWERSKQNLLLSSSNSLLSESLSGYDSAYGILAWWQLPVMLSVQSALIIDVRRCARCHLHIQCTLIFHKARSCTH